MRRITPKLNSKKQMVAKMVQKEIREKIVKPSSGRLNGRARQGLSHGFQVQFRPGEGRSVLLFFAYAFLLLVCYYILKTLREPLLLVNATAEIKAYAYAAIALLLMFMVPLYGVVRRHTDRSQLIRWITVFFLTNLLIFCLIGLSGTDIAFAYYVWVGVFSVMILAQFWAHAADTFNPASGQRLFPVIMAGATLGGLAGPLLVRVLFPLIGPWWLMFIAGLLLAATLPLVGWTRECVPETSRNTQNDDDTHKGCFLGGLWRGIADE